MQLSKVQTHILFCKKYLKYFVWSDLFTLCILMSLTGVFSSMQKPRNEVNRNFHCNSCARYAFSKGNKNIML